MEEEEENKYKSNTKSKEEIIYKNEEEYIFKHSQVPWKLG